MLKCIVLLLGEWIGEAAPELKYGFRPQIGAATLVEMGHEIQESYKNVGPALSNIFTECTKAFAVADNAKQA